MAKKKEPSEDTQAVAAKVGQEFLYVESNTLVTVMQVNKDDGTVAVQEKQEDGGRYWGAVAANTDCLKPAK